MSTFYGRKYGRLDVTQNPGLSSKRSEVICARNDKKRVFVTPLSFEPKLLRNPLEYLHEPYTT